MLHSAKRYIRNNLGKNLLLFCVLASVMSCSSSSPPLRYYLLHGVSSATSSDALNFERHLVLNTLVIPEYLKQAGLVYQLSPAQLHISQSHFWSESVDTGINQIIRESLASDGTQLVLPSHSSSQASGAISLVLFIDDFLPTWQGHVVLKGRYELKGENGTSQFKSFHYTKPLEEDGFEYSTLAMRSAIVSLSKDISNSLEAL